MNLDPDDVSAFAVQQLLVVGGGARRAQLESWGVDRAALNRMLRRGLLHRQGRGYYVLPWSGASDDRWQRQRSEHLRAVSAVVGKGSVTGSRSAALALGLPVSQVPPIPEILRLPHASALKGARVIRRFPDPRQIVMVNGVPVTNLERTAVDIALDLPTPEALITVDAALRRGADPYLMAAILEGLGSVTGCHRARQTLDWGDAHSESPLESRGRGELMLQRVPRPWSNVNLRLGEVEVRPDHWWDGLGIAGEADGRGKYDGPTAPVEPIWSEKLRQEWFEEELGILVVRYIDREIRRAPADVAARWRRREARRAHQPWEPPPGLEIFQRPLKGSSDPIRWFRRRDEGAA